MVGEWRVAVGVSLSEALAAFLEDRRARNRSPRTVEYYRWQLERFIAWLLARDVSDLAGLEPRQIRGYIIHLQEQGWAGSSQHCAARAIRAWCGFLVADDYLALSPMAKVGMPKKPKKILPALAGDDVRRLLAAAINSRDRALLLFLVDSGVRAAELVALNVGDVNLDTGEVFVRSGKGAKSRRTYIEERARAALAEYLAERGPLGPEEPLWASHQQNKQCGQPEVTFTAGARLTKNGLQTLLVRLAQRAGVEHAGPHAFRRTCAVTMYRAGMPVPSIAGLLGHDDLETLRRYLDLHAADYAAAHRQHSPVALLGL